MEGVFSFSRLSALVDSKLNECRSTGSKVAYERLRKVELLAQREDLDAGSFVEKLKQEA